MNRLISVDFDGVIAQYTGWKGVNHFEPPIEGAREFLTELKKMGFTITIFTQRMSKLDKKNGFTSDEARTKTRLLLMEYLLKHQLPFDSIWTGDGKPPAIAFIDDRAVGCRPQFDKFAYPEAINAVEKIVWEGTKLKSK